MRTLRLIMATVFVLSFMAVACDDDDDSNNNTNNVNNTNNTTNNTNNNDTETNCTDGVDNDSDGLIDCNDPDCDNDPACSETNNNDTETNCADGIDNDGDDLIDCNDPDCDDDPACATSECTIDTVFYDSPATCEEGFVCSVNQSYEATCVDEANTSGGTFYGDCGANGECPFGSICAGTSAEDQSCMPFCQTDTHPDCPEDGQCLYGLQDSTLNLCGVLETCDLIDQDCGTGEGCYVIDQDGTTGCTGAGTAEAGDSCVYTNDCVAGAMCGGDGVCMTICEVGVGDECVEGETCTDMGLSGDEGFCVAAQ